VRGPHVFKGYWQRPDATEEAFDADGWFSTGDLGWRSKDGYYTISGRARELIISGGFNVYPREVEEVLLRHPAIAQVSVIAVPDDHYGEEVCAVVIRTEEQPDASADEIIAWARERMAAYKYPRLVRFVDAMPLGPSGKVLKRELAARFAGREG
jgi:acyl-CoA synthetase (AMP-forming)/AMP-acid ligase II